MTARAAAKSLLITFILSGVLQAQEESSSGLSVEIGDAPAAPITYVLEELASGFNHPSSIAFISEDIFLISERNAGLTLVVGGERVEISGMPSIHAQRQAGLHDVTVHPNFSENSLIYFSYSHGDAKANATRLARAKLMVSDGAEPALQDFKVLFTPTPMSGTSAHYGGRIAFLADGTLLLTLGEGYRYKDQAVKLDNHFGKVVRLNDDGSVPDDNPFVNTPGAMPEIFSYGHRNPQGLIVDPDGTIFLHEHGPRGGDEINLLRAGANYGWPEITYGIDYSGAIISEFHQRDGMEQSIVHYVPSIAPSGFTRYAGDLFPEWQGDLFLGGLAGKQVRHIEISEEGKFGEQQTLFTELNARIRDVTTGPDAAIYFVTDSSNGSLYRVTPK